MAEQIPITPVLLTWARNRAGLSAEAAKEYFPKIASWEAGESFPTYSQLEQLADRFKVPVGVFFFPEPPELPDIEESFRTLPDSEIEEMPPRMRYLLRKAKALQLNLGELSNGRNPAPRLITNDLDFEPNVNVAVMAQQVREYLGISVEEQTGWATVEIALEKWRQVFVDAGVFVFKDAFRADQYSGFCLYDELFPLIYVNNSTAKSRQIFTLFHELSHLLFDTSGIDTFRDQYIATLQGDAARIEVICNRFAAAFLVPDNDFVASMRGREASEEVAEVLAARFKVSREVIFRRFLDRGLIEQEVYDEAAARWAAQRNTGTGGDFYNNQFAYLGSKYIDMALSMYHQNRINEVQASEYLNIAPKNLANFEARYASRRG